MDVACVRSVYGILHNFETEEIGTLTYGGMETSPVKNSGVTYLFMQPTMQQIRLLYSV